MRGFRFPPGTREYYKYMRWQWWVEAYFVMKDFGVLPHGGGYFDQDWKVMEILSIIKSTYIKEAEKKNG